MRWTSARLDQLELAARTGRRVVLVRRGTEYVVVARRVGTVGGRDALTALLPMTGEELVFRLEEIESLHVLEP
ncbi:MAG TPA: hypothetical protein VLA95_06325 [Gemmatimonadales bacterium]|nr:hypothetical protein [Gemmatimonadales bacterium]